MMANGDAEVQQFSIPFFFFFFFFFFLLTIKVNKGAKIRNRFNQVPHLTQNTNGKATDSQLDGKTKGDPRSS